MHRFRVEHMERQLANLTGLVQKALIQNPTGPSSNANYLGVPGCRGGKIFFCFLLSYIKIVLNMSGSLMMITFFV